MHRKPALFLLLLLFFPLLELQAQRRRGVVRERQPEESTRYRQLAAGGGSACAIREDGAAFCWGHGAFGELGIGSFPGAMYRPVRVEGGPWEQISVGGEGACGLSNGVTYCWGSDLDGGLGRGFVSTGCGGTAEWNSGCSPVPVPLAGDFRFVTLSAGGNVQRTFSVPFVRFNCGITADGETLCWGSDSGGALGDGAQYPAQVPYPQPVATDVRFVSISTGLDHTCALDTDGRAWCWGEEQWGELGNDAALSGVTAIPEAVDTLLRFRRIETARNHTCGITVEGEAYCWGLGHFGQLGAEGLNECGNDPRFPMPCSPRPMRVASDSRFVEIATGIAHTCAIDDEGAVFCWGSGFEAGVGADHPSFVPCAAASVHPCVTTPVRAETQQRFTQIEAGRIFTCALSMEGNVFCWGSDTNALAQGIGRAVYTPARIVEPASGHESHSVAPRGAMKARRD